MLSFTVDAPLSVPHGYEPNRECNGCGSGWNVRLVPDHILRLYVGDVCCVHDDEYNRGNTVEEKRVADVRMHINLKVKINAVTKWWYPKRAARGIAWVYYQFVDKFGHRAYWKGKRR